MRVLVVTPWFPSPTRPGLGLFNLRDVELLARDHEVTVLHLDDPAHGGKPGEWITEFGVPVRRLDFHSARLSSYISTLRQIRISLRSAEVLHSMAFHALLPAKLAGAAVSRVPWIHTEHWSALLVPPSKFSARAGRTLLRPWLRAPKAVVAVGQELADVIDATRHDRTRVIGNYVRLASPGEAPPSFNFKTGETLRITAVGRLVAWKGPVETVEAVAALRDRGIRATLDWAGVGPLEGAVRDRARQLGIADRVNLLGHVPPENLSALLLGSHLFVMPTEGETFGISFAEALGHGLPVVTSGVGGHIPFLPARASRIVSERTAAQVADAVVDLMTDPNRWSAADICRYAQDKFSEERRRDSYAEIYASILEG